MRLPLGNSWVFVNKYEYNKLLWMSSGSAVEKEIAKLRSVGIFQQFKDGKLLPYQQNERLK
jgi:hypothetical protein